MRVRKRLGGSPGRVMTWHIHTGLYRFQIIVCGEDREDAKPELDIVWKFWARDFSS